MLLKKSILKKETRSRKNNSLNEMYGIFNIFNKERNLSEEVFVGKQMISAVPVIYFSKTRVSTYR